MNCPVQNVEESQGYLSVALYKNGTRKDYRTGRLVGKYFVDNPENKPEINHKNGIVDCDESWNLEWTTPKENIRHAFDNGLNKVPKGFSSHASKLTKRDINNVLLLRKEGHTQTDISKMVGISQSHVSRILRKETGHFGDTAIDIKTLEEQP